MNEPCDCDKFPAMHDRYGVCVNWLRHAVTVRGVQGDVRFPEKCIHA